MLFNVRFDSCAKTELYVLAQENPLLAAIYANVVSVGGDEISFDASVRAEEVSGVVEYKLDSLSVY